VADVEFRLGQLYEQHYGRPDKAISHYRKAFEADPQLVPAIYAAREIYRSAGNHKAAATLFELEVKAEPSRDRRIALLRELAHVRAQELHDLGGAVKALERALENAPGDLAVMHELASFFLQRADQRGGGPAADAERQQAADLMYQMAQSVAPDHAMAYLESALDASPGHDAALELLERLATDHGREDLLPLRWVGYLQAAPAAPGADQRRKRLGFAYLDAGQPEDAIVCLEALLDIGDAEAAEALVELYRERGRDEDATHALGVAVAGLPPEKRLPRLREMVADLQRRGDTEGALHRAHEVLEIEPGDAEAIDFLEREYRAREDHVSLRDVMLRASRVPNLGLDAKKHRLREVAELSEGPLEDPEGAIGAWRAISALDPTDAIAQDSLARLLREHGRWDELAQVLDRKTLSLTDPDEKADLLLEIALIHRDERGDLDSAMGALHALRQIRPTDPRARDALCDVYLMREDFQQGLPLLEERVEDATERDERARLLELLASILESRVGDDEGAFAASARLLDDDPSDLDALDRMERIDTRNENFPRLIETLSYRAEVVEGERRAALLRRMGGIADERLGDLDRAADYYQQALDIVPGDVEVLDALCTVYDRSERYRDLVVLLRERAQMEEDSVGRAELYRRIARTLQDRVRNEDAAAEAWEKVLDAGEDEEALRALRDHSASHADMDRLEGLLARLAQLVETDDERRDLLVERAGLLTQLDRDDEAIDLLRHVVGEVDPLHLPAMYQLADLCASKGDTAGLADALERQLGLIEDDGLRQPIAERLADLYEGELADPGRAIEALYAWCIADPTDLAPRVRLVDLLTQGERWPELVDCYDALAQLELDPDKVSQRVRSAADVAAHRLGDWDGAWARLEPRISYDDDADSDLRRIAEESGRHQQLADLFVRHAQTAEDPETQRRRWRDAAVVLEGPLGDAGKALEAMLRAYATDLADEEMLSEVDRLAGLANAWVRLGQVYERLLRTVESPTAKIRLLLRHATLLDEHGGDPSEALDRVLRACALSPDDDEILSRAEEMAPRAGRADELIVVYERRKARADDDATRIDALLRATRLCDAGLKDRERAFSFVAQAVALTVRSPELTEHVEDAVRELDEVRPELGRQDAIHSLVNVYRRLGDDSEDDPVRGARLLLRAARLLADDLNDDGQAFDCLKLASTYAGIPEVLDALETFVERTHRWEELDQHLAYLIREAFDSKTAAELLNRRGRVLEEVLQRYEEAAEVFRQLVTVAKDDEAATDKLLRCLRRAGKHQDLLMVLEQEIRKADDERKVVLLRESASVWERELDNRWEAQDIWKKVLKIAPDDPEATEALKRLGQSTRKLAPSDLADAASDLSASDVSEANVSGDEVEDLTGDEVEELADLDAVESLDGDEPPTMEVGPEEIEAEMAVSEASAGAWDQATEEPSWDASAPEFQTPHPDVAEPETPFDAPSDDLVLPPSEPRADEGFEAIGDFEESTADGDEALLSAHGGFLEEFTVAETEASLDEMFPETAARTPEMPHDADAGDVDPYGQTMAVGLDDDSGELPAVEPRFDVDRLAGSTGHVALLDEDGEEQDLMPSDSLEGGEIGDSQIVSEVDEASFSDVPQEEFAPLGQSEMELGTGDLSAFDSAVDLGDVELLEEDESVEMELGSAEIQLEDPSAEVDLEDLEFIDEPPPPKRSVPPPPPGARSVPPPPPRDD